MNKFSAAAIGFMAGSVGIGGIKQIPVTRTMLKGTDVEYDKKVSLGEILARGIKDDYGLPGDLKAIKNASRGFENKLSDRFADKEKVFDTILLNKLEGFYDDMGWKLVTNPYINQFFIWYIFDINME